MAPTLLVLFVAVAAHALPPREPERNGLSAFEQNRLSVIEWISQLLSSQASETNPPPPDPIDSSKCEPCTCGLTNKMTRIVGGKETQVNQYPWMALLTYNGNFYCGGSLISQRYVLTAAHCVHGFRSSKIRVRLLEHDQKAENETTTIERGVKYVVRHPSYNQNSLDHDLALLRLDEDVSWSKNLRPVCLPPLKKSFAGEQGIVTGWGVKTPSKVRRGVSTTLQELTVPVMTNDECRNTGYEKGQITENMLCAGYKEGGKDSCQGDSGGPLHFNNNSFHCIIGVVSWGMGCARPNYPGVYTRVNRYNPWIEKHTADSCFCQPTRYLKDEPDAEPPVDEAEPSAIPEKSDEMPSVTETSKAPLISEATEESSAAQPDFSEAVQNSEEIPVSSVIPNHNESTQNEAEQITSTSTDNSISAEASTQPTTEQFGQHPLPQRPTLAQPAVPNSSAQRPSSATESSPSLSVTGPFTESKEPSEPTEISKVEAEEQESEAPSGKEASPTPSQKFDIDSLGDLAALYIFGDDEVPLL